MIKKLHNQFNFKTVSDSRNSSLLTSILIIILYLGGMSHMQASFETSNLDAVFDTTISIENPTTFPKIIKSYRITDASTENKSCFPTKGIGVIFQRADGCAGLHHIWRVKNELSFNEYDNGTAAIVGSVIDDEGKIGQVNIILSDKNNQGTTWNAACYLEGVADPRSLYQSFNGTITVDGNSFSVEKQESEKHFILAEGAGFQAGQYGFGAWTSGSFGGCTEWFGNLDPIDIDCELQVDLGDDIEICGQEVVLSAALSGEGACTDVCEYIVSAPVRCNGSNSYVFTMGGQFASDNVRFYELSNGTARYTADATNGVDRITIDITYSDKTFTSPSDSPKLNNCEATDATGWRYYQTTTGTVVSENHGVFSLTRKGPSFQIGNSAMHIAPGYGASGWLSISGGDGTYTNGDVNIALAEECMATPNSGPSYLWSNGATTPSITVSEEGAYSVIVTDCTGCIAADTVNVQVSNVAANAGDDVSIRSGESTNLSATGGGSYIWSTGETTATITVSPDETTTFSVMVTSDKGLCTDADEVIVRVDCAMEVNLGEDLQFCKTVETTLTANLENIPLLPSIIASYNITDADTSRGICENVHGNEQGVMLQKGNSEFAVTGRYNAWKVKESLVLNEYDNQTAKIAGTVIDEHGNIGVVDVLLFDKQDQGNSWSATCYEAGLVGPKIFYQSFYGTISVNGKEYTIEPKETGQHFILAEGASLEPNQFGFGAWTAGTFGSGGEWFGNLDPIEIEDCNDLSYVWSTGETTSSIVVSESGEYTVTVKACNGCTASDSIVVEMLNPKAYELEGGDSFCIDEAADYLTDDTIQVLGDIVGANSIFIVTDANGKILGLPATLKALQDIDFNSAGTGSCLIWHLAFEDGLQGATIDANANDLEGCFDLSNPIEVIRNAAPTANAGEDVSICKDAEAILTVSGTGTYVWSTGETTASITVSPKADTIYSVIVTSAEGCEATDEVKVSLNPDVAADAGQDVSICKDAEAILTVSGTGTYLWSTGETTASITVSPKADTIYSVIVTSAEGCEATDEVKVSLNPDVTADAGNDIRSCVGEEVELTVLGTGTYVWSTGETTATIIVAPTVNTAYTVTVTSADGCEATDDVMISVEEKVTIGDFVWLDQNENGRQDDAITGVNDVTVTLFQCNGAEVDSTVTADNTNGEPGSYSFEVCQNSGEYYVVFGNIPDGLEFTSSNSGDDTIDSDANENGRTDCFEVTTTDNPTIDGGLTEICNITADAGEDGDICSGEVVELTAAILDDTTECPGGCVYPVKNQERCYGPTGDFEIYLISGGDFENFKFKASEQKFERYADNTARYTATATNGKDVIKIDALYTGYTIDIPVGSPKLNSCQEYTTSDWEYWTTWSGTITSENHGVFNLSVKQASFQMGVGADVTRTGFGASGWFYVDGGDGFYSEGDVNVALEECIEENISYQWTTEDGNIIGLSNQKTIRVNEPGTYKLEAINCIDCVAIDVIKLTKATCGLNSKNSAPKMSTVYPVPVRSGGTLTIEFDIPDTSKNDEGFNAVPLKATVDYLERNEEVGITLYDMTGRVISMPRIFKIVNGKAVIYLDLDHIPSGKYILRAQGPNWSDSKNVLVK